MNYIDNWKYKKWEKSMKESQHTTEYNLNMYRNLELYPEDIEIFMTVLFPTIIEINNQILFDIDGDRESYIREEFRKKDKLNRSDSERQKDWNCVNVSNIFFNNVDKTEDKTLINIANLIKFNWEYYLIKKFPNRKFIVEIIGEKFDPEVTFYEYK